MRAEIVGVKAERRDAHGWEEGSSSGGTAPVLPGNPRQPGKGGSEMEKRKIPQDS